VAELTTLHAVGQALSSTLDLDDLLRESLDAVVRHLGYDRALVLLVDEEELFLESGRSVPPRHAAAAVVAGLRIPLWQEESHLVQVFRSERPLLFENADEDEAEVNRSLARVLGVRSFLGTPLITKGRRVGILAVENGLTGRPLSAVNADLLFTVGNQIASAVENARLYRQIEEQNRMLEERVRQRTEELGAALAAAEAATETKSAFLANVSHELRTPLTSVLGFAKIIKKRLSDNILPHVTATDPRTQRAVRQVTENLDIMISEGERLTAMINDVLDLAKIEAGKLEWKEEQVTLTEIVHRAAAATSSLFAQKDLPLTVEVQDGLPPAMGDPDRFIQVVINLLSNAVKFTNRGGVACRVCLHGAEIVVSVADTGTGIDPADHAKVFEQFRQVGDTLTDKPQGTGLGLPICKEIVEHHGGRIWVESELGEGSTFSFSLPCVDGAGGGHSGDPIARPSQPGAGGPLRRVLVVDDDDAIRRLLRQELGAAGYEVQEAKDGHAAVSIVEAQRPDLVILDVLMPGLDGFAVAGVLRDRPDTADVPIIVLTVVDGPERDAHDTVDRYITKPFDAGDLVREVGILVARDPSG